MRPTAAALRTFSVLGLMVPNSRWRVAIRTGHLNKMWCGVSASSWHTTQRAALPCGFWIAGTAERGSARLRDATGSSRTIARPEADGRRRQTTVPTRAQAGAGAVPSGLGTTRQAMPGWWEIEPFAGQNF